VTEEEKSAELLAKWFPETAVPDEEFRLAVARHLEKELATRQRGSAAPVSKSESE
jgi:hypothetical protein